MRVVIRVRTEEEKKQLTETQELAYQEEKEREENNQGQINNWRGRHQSRKYRKGIGRPDITQDRGKVT